ncbi:MAG TPA: hypothetical protein VFN67_25115 [Polyangiales bacterium]|nr:hypothetical protein [Polyangiales bacterium]
MNGLIARHRSWALCILVTLPAAAACGAAEAPAPVSSTAPTAAPAATAAQAPAAATVQGVAGAAATAPGSATPAGNIDNSAMANPAVPNLGMAMTATAAAADPNAYPDLRGGCAINSGYPDDHACITAPAPSEGIQIHIGPKNYNDPAEVAKFIMKPGEESSQCWTYRTPNTEDIFFQSYVLSGRAGTHHVLGSKLQGDLPIDQAFGRCADTREGGEVVNLGPMPMATKAYMPRTHVAPENEHIAQRLPANVLAQADMHYYNFTDHDILREIWINLYTAPKEQITGEVLRIRGMGGFGWNDMPIEPGTNMVYQYECPIVGEGRILELLGHYHAHGVRFGASLKRKAGTPEKVFEMYSYEDPAGFEYNSVTKNPAFTQNAAGAFSGILEVHDGDVLAWECHIINDSDTPLHYTNEVKTGEMCNLWGHSFGIKQWDCIKK